MARSECSSFSTAMTFILPSSTTPTMPMMLLVPISMASTTSLACSFICGFGSLTAFCCGFAFTCSSVCVFLACPLAMT